MKKFGLKIKLSIILILLATLVVLFSPVYITYASLSDQGSKTLSGTSQSTIQTFSQLGTYNLYATGSNASNNTQNMYTTKLTNLSNADVLASINYAFCGSDFTIHVNSSLSTKTSAENPRASTMFQISGVLQQLASRDCLSVVANASMKSTKDKVAMGFYNGSYSGTDYTALSSTANSATTSAATSSSYSSKTLTLGKNVNKSITANAFLVVFVTESTATSSWLGRENHLYVNNPYVTFTSLDTIAPNISNISYDNTWTNTNKTIALTVADNQGGSQTYLSGIQSVTVNGTELSYTNSNNNNVNTYQFTASPDVDEYTIVMTDASGNSASRTYNKTEFKIDAVDVGVPTIVMDEIYTEKHISITSSYVFDNLSPETLHYELYRHGESEIVQAGNLNFGSDSIDIADNGTYDIVYYVTDSAGHGSNTINTTNRTFIVDDVKHEIIVNIHNGTLVDVINAECQQDGDIYRYYSLVNQQIQIVYTPNPTYTYVLALQNGNDIPATIESCAITTTGDDNIDIYLKYVLQVEDYVDEYVFTKDGNIEPVFALNVDENVQNSLDINLVYTGTDTTLFNAGVYTVSWSYEDDEYIGSGSFDIEILPSQQIVQYIQITGFVYTGNAQSVTYSPFADFDIAIKYYQNDVEVSFCNAGTYCVKPVSLDENYILIDSDIDVIISPVCINVSFTQNVYTYTGNAIGLEYDITNEDGGTVPLTDSDMQYVVGDNVVDIVNVGTYLLSMQCSNTNYIVVSVMNNTITISPKPTYVVSIPEYRYTGEAQIFTYTLSEDIESSYIVSTILDAGEYEYSITSDDENYVVVLENNTFIVLPMLVYVDSIVDEYIYNCDEQIVEYSLTRNINHEYIVSQESVTPFENVGDYTVEFISTDSNYEIVDGVGTLHILPLEIIVNVTNDTFTYNGENNYVEIEINGTPNYTIQYYVGSDPVDDISNVGDYDWTLILDDNNYIGTASGTIHVVKRTAYVVACSGQCKTYGDEDPELIYNVENLVGDDTVVAELTRVAGEEIGVYYIDIVNFASTNYELDYSGAYFRIIPKQIIVIADKKTKTYSTNDPELTYKIIMNGVVVESLLGNDVLNGVLQRSEGEDVGTYDITIGTISNDNYNILFKASTLEIVQMDVVINIDDKSVVYGSNVDLTYKIVTDCNTDEISGNIIREQGENVGMYTISGGTLASDNYNLIIKNGTYTITKKPVVVTAQETHKIYGESETLEYIATGLINDDVLTGSLTRVTGENVGIYDILLGTLNNDNYDIEYIGSTLTIVRTEITLTVESKTQVYNEIATPLTYKIDGLKNDDQIGVRVWRAAGSNAGEYGIFYELSNCDNYTLVNTNIGVYTITRASSSLHLADYECVYDGLPHIITTDEFDSITYVYKQNGFVVDEMIDAGEYEVQAFFDGNANYNGSRSNIAVLTINKQTVPITLGENEFVYDGETKFPEYYYNKNTGILESAILYEFENDIIPLEPGEYNYRVYIYDNNYEGSASGVITIKNKFTIQEDNYMIESTEATFNSAAQSVSLIKLDSSKKYNGQKVLSKYTLVSDETECVSDNKCVYTVRIKANGNNDQAYVYRVNEDSVTQIAVTKEDGYYVFKVDSLGDEYIITEDFEPVNMMLIIAIVAGGLLIGAITVTSIAIAKKRKKKSVRVSSVPTDTYNVN